MPPFISSATTETKLLKDLNLWLLAELNALRSKHGKMAVTGAGGETAAAQANAQATAVVALVHDGKYGFPPAGEIAEPPDGGWPEAEPPASSGSSASSESSESSEAPASGESDADESSSLSSSSESSESSL